jgi:mycothiol system anti-sigma-R factor
MHELNCEQAIAKLGDYVDRQLSGEEVALVQRHLEHCEGCRHAFRWEGSILSHVRKCAESAAPEGLLDRLIGNIKSE